MASAQTTEAAHYALSQRNPQRAYYESLLDNPNVQRGLHVLRTTEGTQKKKDPYSTAFGGGTIKSLRDHPRKSHSFTQKNGKKNRTTAAGAYQFLSRTWDGVATKLGLIDFTKKSQDIAALAQIDSRKGLNALINGDLVGFVKAVGPEWASLPTAPDSYSQPKVGWNKVNNAWNNALSPTPGKQKGYANLPKTMEAPLSHAATLAKLDQQAKIASAYRDPFRALDTAPNIASSRLASPLPAAPRGTVSRAPLKPDTPRPMPASMPRPAGKMTAPSYSAPRMMAPAQTAPTQRFSGTAVDKLANGLAAMPNVPNTLTPSALPPDRPMPSGPLPATPQSKLAAQYAQYRTPTNYAVVRDAVAVPQQAPPSPMALPSSLPALPSTNIPDIAAPVAVKGPRLQAPLQMPDPARFGYDMPQTPQYSAGDIYGGQVGSALDNTGQNTVSRDAYGRTSVTNKYGATTVTMPDGKQAAQWGGLMPDPSSVSLGEVSPEPGRSKFGNAARKGVGTFGGAAVGSFGGPIGSVIGALLGRELAKPGGGVVGGFLNGVRNIDTSNVSIPGFNFGQTTQFARPQGGLAFPNAPAMQPGMLGAKGSNLSRSEMGKISERAASAISKGKGGLY